MSRRSANVLLLALAVAATPSHAGRGGSSARIADAITSSSPDAIVAELERAEKLPCISCIELVMPLVDAPSPRVRRVAAWWLGKRGVRVQLEHDLLARLVAADVIKARNAAEALGELRDPAAVPGLSAYLAQSTIDGPSLAAAATALGRIGHASARPSLVRALALPQPEARAAALAALRQLGPGTDASALLPLLTDGNEGVRSEATYTLGALGDARAVTALTDVLAHDTSAAVRKHAAWALGEIGDGSAASALATATHDPDSLVRSIARAAASRLR